MSVNFVTNDNQIFNRRLSDREVRQLAQQKTVQEMKPEKFDRNSNLIFAATLIPYFLTDIMANPSSKVILKFLTLGLTIAGFDATDDAIKKRSPSYKKFKKENPMSSMLMSILSFMFLHRVIDKGLEYGGIYDKASSVIDSKTSKISQNIKSKNFYQNIKNFIENKPKLNNAINGCKNGFKQAMASPAMRKFLAFSPFLVVPAFIYRNEHYKNKFKDTYMKNYQEIKMANDTI